MEKDEDSGQHVDLSSILKGVIVHVDVRSGEDNRTEIFRGTLAKLGATVTRGLNKTVTHLVFFNGPKKTYEKAKKMGIHLLSAKWVIECHRLLTRVPENEFPAVISSEYDCPFSKIKMMKSLRPLSCEEYRKRDIANKKRQETRRIRKEILLKYKDTPPAPYIPKDYSKYGLIDYDPSELRKCFERVAALLSSEDEYDMDANDVILPLPLRILKNNPLPDSPIINSLTRKQRKAAEIFFNKCGKSLKNEPEIPIGEISDSLSNIEEVLKEMSPNEEIPEPQFPVAALAQTPGTTLPKQKNCLNETPRIKKNRKRSKLTPVSPKLNNGLNSETPRVKKKRKRSKLTPLTDLPKLNSGLSETSREKKKRKRSKLTPTPSPKTPHIKMEKQESKNSLDEFKPQRVQKRRKLINFDQLLEDTRRLSIDEPVTPGTRLKGINETKRLILTSYEQWEKETVIPVIQHLGCYRLENNIRKGTTHVICRYSRRTFNVLMGIVSGCWILNGDWIMKSLETGKWVDEEPFELSSEYPGSRIARLRRMEKGANYKCNLFKNIGTIYVSNKTNLPRRNLLLLLENAGAEVISRVNDAVIVITNKMIKGPAKCVNEQWILESITHHIIFPLNNFRLHN